jgi:hypothetical protein
MTIYCAVTNFCFLASNRLINCPATCPSRIEDRLLNRQKLNDVVSDPAYAAILPQLKQQFLELNQRVGDLNEKYPDLMQVRNQVWAGC